MVGKWGMGIVRGDGEGCREGKYVIVGWGEKDVEREVVGVG